MGNGGERDGARGYRAWDRIPTDAIQYGPDVGTEADFKLLGILKGKRILELGAGGGQRGIAAARQGAHVIAVDTSEDLLAAARRRCEREEVRVELRHADLADLAFVRADSIDIALSVYALAEVDDLGRVFRQVHRVLKTGAPLVFSLPHPAGSLLGDDGLVVRRSYFDRSLVEPGADDTTHPDHHRTIAELVTFLSRANFRVDAILEPEPVPGAPRSPFWREAYRYVPQTLVIRGRKEGV